MGDTFAGQRGGMSAQALRRVLWLHTACMGIAGVVLFVLPAAGALLWPWALPPLAARLLGSLLIAGAVCSLDLLRARDSSGLFVIVLLAVGDVLIAASALLGVGETGISPGLLVVLAVFGIAAVLLTMVVLPAVQDTPPGAPVPRLLHVFFFVHLLVVLPVGLAMFLAPAWTQPLWPWRMSQLNVRLIGSFFFGAAFISAWALRQRTVESLRATLALYAAFATLATTAALIHVNQFDPARLATWAFFTLYVFVAAGSLLFLLRMRRAG